MVKQYGFTCESCKATVIVRERSDTERSLCTDCYEAQSDFREEMIAESELEESDFERIIESEEE